MRRIRRDLILEGVTRFFDIGAADDARIPGRQGALGRNGGLHPSRLLQGQLPLGPLSVSMNRHSAQHLALTIPLCAVSESNICPIG